MNLENDQHSSTGGFQFILKWSGIFFIILILIGFMYRLLVPVKLNLNEEDYIKRVFTTDDAQIYTSADVESAIGEVDAGTILYVIEEEDDFYMIRPFIRTDPDSVWISEDNVSDYSAEQYEAWQKQVDAERFGLDEN